MRVTLSDIYKSFGNVEVVKGLDLEISEGEFLVLLGPSGCGKTTALRMVAGLESVTSGKISIGDRDVTEVLPKYRDVAMVFQSYALYPHMTVAANIGYPLKLRKVPKAEQATQIREAAEKVHLEDYLDRFPRQLSGGQRQRVALARAIVRRPSVFLMDEPLSNLDAKLRSHMRVEIKHLQRSLGITSVYVTHDQLEAMTLADKLVVMNAGKVEQIGAPLDVYERPASTFVASFIGAPAMNLIPFSALGDDGRLGLRDAAVATIGFRPQDIIEVANDNEDGDGLSLRFVVDAVEPVGSESYLHGKVGDERVVVRIDGRAPHREGDRIGIAVPSERLHAFDADGRRLEGWRVPEAVGDAGTAIRKTRAT
ncbi:MAG: sn-glycerol-3-phosphate ABC transporter ATP-binding protein UgpC [Nitratireductor sp.]